MLCVWTIFCLHSKWLINVTHCIIYMTILNCIETQRIHTKHTLIAIWTIFKFFSVTLHNMKTMKLNFYQKQKKSFAVVHKTQSKISNHILFQFEIERKNNTNEYNSIKTDDKFSIFELTLEKNLRTRFVVTSSTIYN